MEQFILKNKQQNLLQVFSEIIEEDFEPLSFRIVNPENDKVYICGIETKEIFTKKYFILEVESGKYVNFTKVSMNDFEKIKMNGYTEFIRIFSPDVFVPKRMRMANL